MKATKRVLIAAILALAVPTGTAFAGSDGPGVTDKEIKIGQTQPCSGPVSAWSVQGRVEAASDSTAAFAYMTSQLIELVLRNCGNDLSRENLLKQATTLKDVELPLFLPGIKVGYSPTNYTPITKARMARFDGSKWVRFGELVSTNDDEKTSQ